MMGIDFATTGVIQAVNGQSPGPASGITYDVLVNIPGAGPTKFDGVVPSHRRWPDSIDTLGAEVGDVCYVVSYGGDVLFFIIEVPDTTECTP